jgi:amino acid adenylation domain-containing protein
MQTTAETGAARAREHIHRQSYDNATVVERFEAQVRRTPSAEAIDDAGVTLTYAELNARANAMGRRLLGSGVGRESLVGVALGRGAELITAQLAILKTSAAYVPFDATLPAERVRFLIHDSGMRVLFAGKEFDHLSIPPSVEVIRAAEVMRASSSDEESDLGIRIVPQNLAYVIYTSGSTGQPKGVMAQHASIVRLVCETDYISISRGDRVLHLANVAFDASTFEVWGALLNGACVVILPFEQAISSGKLNDHVNAGSSILFLTTALFNHVAESFVGAKTLLFGGEQCDMRFVRKLLERGAVSELRHVYGPTECTTFATSFCVSRRDAERTNLPIGKAIRGTSTYVLDERLEQCAEGRSGELYIAGAGVARGYLRRPVLTAERFVPDPFGIAPGGRLYRTGDLVRLLPGGNVEFLGRIDHQVKLRGFRVELGEVEFQLRAHPAVREALVVLKESPTRAKHLVAYVGSPGGMRKEGALIRSLRTKLQAVLPSYMVPAAFVVLERLPLNMNGKIDRSALPEPDFLRVAVADFEAATTDTERAVLEVWRHHLRVDQIGATAKFLDLGGDSLLAAKVLASLRQTFGVDLPPTVIFEAPTIRALARYLDDHGVPPTSSPLALVPVDHSRPLALSFAQQRIWLIDRLSGGSPYYNIAFSFFLQGRVQPEALERAFNAVVERHEALRTSFHEEDGVPFQLVLERRQIELRVERLLAAEQNGAAVAIRRAQDEEASFVFSLEKDHLLRVRLLQLGSTEWVLLVTFHHIITDGWSVALITRELASAYAAELRGSAAEWASQPVQYADFAAWQRQALQPAAVEKQLTYWLDHLKGMPATHGIPLDLSRPEQPTFAGGAVFVSVPEHVVLGLKQLARTNEATLFMVVASAFASLLARWSQEDDVVIAFPTAARSDARLSSTVGFFINTLLLRVDLGGGPSFGELLSRVRTLALAASSNSDVPFDWLVDRLRPERELKHHTLFQIMLSYHNEDPIELSLENARGTRVELSTCYCKFDMNLSVMERGNSLEIIWEYSRDLFRPETITRQGACLEALLREIIRRPGTPFRQLQLMTTEARDSLLAGARAQHSRLPDEAWVEHLLRKCIAEHSERTALRQGEQSVRYREIGEASDRLAGALEYPDGAPERPIALCLESSVDFVVAVIAALKRRVPYVVLDPRLPTKRLNFILEDSKAYLLLTRPGMVAQLAAERRSVMAVPPGGTLIREWTQELAPGHNRAAAGAGAPLAYIIYTSGTTGAPKGVRMSRRELAGYLQSLWEMAPDLRSPHSTLQFANIASDVHFTDIFLALGTGADLVMFDENVVDKQSALIETIERYEVERVVLPFSALQALASTCMEDGIRLNSLREVVSTGEQLVITPELRQFFQLHSGCRLHNSYGPSETHAVTHAVMPADVALWPQAPSLGKIMGHFSGYICDMAGELVPEGTRGELLVGNICSSAGYWRQPKLTAERFVPDPFGAVPGGRLYRTGDLVRLQPDRSLGFFGRIDHQGKVRGFRVEVAEIEWEIRAHEGVRDVLVVLKDSLIGGKHLVAYLCWQDGLQQQDALMPSLRAELETVLPSYMVPAAFVVLERFPLNANGKVDRKALPDPDFRHIAAVKFEAATTDTERAVLQVWRRYLGVDQIGVTAKFFELGGHSLLIVKVLASLRRTLGVDLPPKVFFEAPTIRALARHIDRCRNSLSNSLPPIVPVDRSRALPLSFAQQSFWIAQQSSNHATTLNVAFRVDLTGQLEFQGLQQSFDALVKRHEGLRTVFRVIDGEPRQLVRGSMPTPLRVYDLQGSRSEEVRRRVMTHQRECAATTFDLSNGPLFVVRVLQTARCEFVMLLCVHHIIFDAWSLQVLLDDLNELYEAAVANRDHNLPLLSLQPGDYAVWERACEQDVARARELEYWGRQLEGLGDGSVLPADYAPREVTDQGRMTWIEVDRDTAARLYEYCARDALTPFTGALAIFVALLYRYSQSRDMCIGVPTSGRHRAGVHDQLGLFVNTLPVRVRVPEHATFAEIVHGTREAVEGMLSHQDVPLELIVRALGATPRRDRHPLFRMTFGFQPDADRDLTLASAHGPLQFVDTETSQFDVSVLCQQRSGGMRVFAVYRTDLFSAAGIEQMLRYFGRLCVEAVRSPTRSILALPLL